MKSKDIYGQTKLRVCSGNLAKTGSKRKGYFRVELVDGGEGKVEVHATYTDKTDTEHTLEPGEILNVTPVSGRSAYEVPREWVLPGAIVVTTFVGGPIALNYIYLKSVREHFS